MKKYLRFLLYILISIGCEEINQPADELQASARGLLSQSSTTEANETEDTGGVVSEPLDLPTSPVTITLNEMRNTSVANPSILNIDVTNTCEEDLEIEIRLSVYGLLAYRAELPLSKTNIKSGESKSWTVPVSRLPIQSDAVISQLDATAIYRPLYVDDDAGAMSTPMYYYRNNADLQTIEIFTEDIFTRKYNSRFRPQEMEMKSNPILGKINKLDGTEEVITDQSEGLKIIHEGKVVGMLSNAYESEDAIEDAEEVLQ